MAVYLYDGRGGLGKKKCVFFKRVALFTQNLWCIDTDTRIYCGSSDIFTINFDNEGLNETIMTLRANYLS